MNRCILCGSRNLKPFLKRKDFPLLPNHTFSTRSEAINIMRGTLDFLWCGVCRCVFNRNFLKKNITFQGNYDATQEHSETFRRHLSAAHRWVLGNIPAKELQILEIGSGNGNFLRGLIRSLCSKTNGVGIDPCYLGKRSFFNGRLKFLRTPIEESLNKLEANVVLCRHSLETLADPKEVLISVQKILSNSGGGRLFLETPSLEHLLKKNAIYSVFYEYRSLFSAHALRRCLCHLGFWIREIRSVFGGQYLWLCAELSEKKRKKTFRPLRNPPTHRNWNRLESRIKKVWLTRLSKESFRSGIALWGGGARGSTFLNVIDPRRKLIRCVIDRNPKKQGRYIGGSAHPILGPRQAFSQKKIGKVVLLNQKYGKEIRSFLRRKRLKIKVLQFY